MVCTINTTVTSAVLLRVLHITTIGNGVTFALITGLGYLVTPVTNTAINPNMPPPLKYSQISGAYFLIGHVLSCVILVAMT